MCVFCNPYCDICKPKFALCTSCGAKAPFAEKECPECGEPITQAAVDRGMEAWAERKAARDAEMRERVARLRT